MAFMAKHWTDTGEWLISRTAYLTPRDRAPKMHWIEYMVGKPAAGSVTRQNDNRESNHGCPVHSQCQTTTTVNLCNSHYGYWATRQHDPGIVVRFPAEVKDLPPLRNIQHSSGAHPASYAMHKGRRGRFFRGDKRAGAWNWQLSSS